MGSRYSETIMEHFLDPKNRGQLENPSGVGVAGTPGQGPYLVFQIAIDDSVVKQARFQCHNCGVTVACGSMLSELVKNKSLDQCNQITSQNLSDALEGVPPDKMHMLSFVLDALKLAISDAAP